MWREIGVEMCRDIPHTCGLDDNQGVLISSINVQSCSRSPTVTSHLDDNLTPSHRRAFGLRI